MNQRINKNRSILINSIIISLIIFVQCTSSSAQVPITLKAAIDTAIKNNKVLKNEKLKSTYQKSLIKTGAAIPLTSLGMEYGQINSSYYDTKFGLAQSINFPTVYTKQKSVLNEEWKSGLLQVTVREIILKKQVSQTFYTLFYLTEKEKLLKRNDSIYSEFLIKSELRFRKGESNSLEIATAENMQGQIRLQLEQLKNDLHIIQIQFQYLLNTSTNFIPAEPQFKMNYTSQIDSSMLTSHPTMKLLEQQKILSANNTSLEKSRLLPDLTIAYSNMSMIGVGSDNKYYNKSTRFQSAQLGIGIPLFFGAQKAKINASKINEEIAANNYINGLYSLQNEYQQALAEYLKYYQMSNYYENSGIQNATNIIRTANEQYKNGEINYLEFVILTNQAISIQNAYIETIKSLNESIINLAYLSNIN